MFAFAFLCAGVARVILYGCLMCLLIFIQMIKPNKCTRTRAFTKDIITYE